MLRIKKSVNMRGKRHCRKFMFQRQRIVSSQTKEIKRTRVKVLNSEYYTEQQIKMVRICNKNEFKKSSGKSLFDRKTRWGKKSK